jgi:hypothetical protein
VLEYRFSFHADRIPMIERSIAIVKIEPHLMLNLKVVGSLQSGKGRVLKVTIYGYAMFKSCASLKNHG